MNQQQKRVHQMETIQKEALELFKNKNHDYGDSFATYGPIGVLMRMGDKLSRYQTIERNKITLVDDENVRDTAIDLMNYAAMVVMLLDETSLHKYKVGDRINYNETNKKKYFDCEIFSLLDGGGYVIKINDTNYVNVANNDKIEPYNDLNSPRYIANKYIFM